jgi:toxin ParE1/3/4
LLRDVDAIVAHCGGLAVFQLRGTARDDIRPGLRTVSYKEARHDRIRVDDVAKRVDILGVFYGGQNYETLLSQPEDAD